jgi:hypothetical protein
MDAPKYSLKDIFGLLREATLTLTNPITVLEDDNKTTMTIAEYVAMSVAHELTDDMSKFAPSGSTKDEVITAMKATGYEEVAFPVYTQFGIIMSGSKQRRSRKQRNRRRMA